MHDKKVVSEKMIRQDHLNPKMIRPIPQPKSPPSEKSDSEDKQKG